MYKFIRRRICDEFYHWEYQYAYIEIEDGMEYHSYLSDELHEELYNWCLFDIGPTIDWHVRSNGVIFFREEHALAFELKYCHTENEE